MKSRSKEGNKYGLLYTHLFALLLAAQIKADRRKFLGLGETKHATVLPFEKCSLIFKKTLFNITLFYVLSFYLLIYLVRLSSRYAESYSRVQRIRIDSTE